MNVLVTGSSGFIGQHIVGKTSENSLQSDHHPFQWIPFSSRNLDVEPNRSYQAVVHCAGLAHQMTEVDDSKYFEINHQSTLRMAELAQRQGAKQFVFLSSSKVFGDDQHQLELTEQTECRPSDAYGESKRRAELDLLAMNSNEFVVSIVRPPLVFGPGVKGNLIRLLKLVDCDWPLPFGNAKAQRSMVNVDNLISLIRHLVVNPVSGIFHAGEAFAPTVENLVRTMRQQMGRAPRLVFVPKTLQKLGQLVVPRLMNRLFGGMLLSNLHTNRVLEFSPPVPFEDGIKKMVDWYRANH
jgi:nucleoside-diphosphate-sugar epimerase